MEKIVFSKNRQQLANPANCQYVQQQNLLEHVQRELFPELVGKQEV